MEKRILGKDLEVSAIGLGCMGMSHAYGPAADKKEMTELLAKAVERGYTFFDTAEVYGIPENPHDNEELLGEALKPFRNQIVLASKCGIRFDESSPEVNKPLIPDGRPESIKKAIDGSLSRLQTDHLDLYYIHRIDRSVPIEETAVQNRYSMMYRDYETLFPVLQELNIGFVAFSPLANGFLTARYNKESRFEKGTDYRSVMPQFTPEAMEKNKEMMAYLMELADRKNATPAQISLAWMLAKESWIVPIPGTRKYSRLIENAQAAEVKLEEQEVKELDRMLDTVPMSEVFGGSRVERKNN